MDQERNRQAASCKDATESDSVLELHISLSDGKVYVGYVQPKKKIFLSMQLFQKKNAAIPVLVQINANDEETMDTVEDGGGEVQVMEEAMEIN